MMEGLTISKGKTRTLPASLQKLRLDSLKLENFRSFQGEVYVGPLLPFTCIVGPNGSGKSSIVEALLFCFCGQQSVYDLRELIHRESSQSYETLTQAGKKCRVEARFESIESRIVLCRQLDASHQQRYFVDYHDVSEENYFKWLKLLGFTPKTHNFSVGQGEVEKLLLCTPTHLTAYFEALSDSLRFKPRYDHLKQELTAVEAQLESTNLRALKIKAQKRQLKTLRQNEKEYQAAQFMYENYLNKLMHAKTLLSLQGVKECEATLKKKREEESLRMQHINEEKVRRGKLQIEKQQLEKRFTQATQRLVECANRVKTITQKDGENVVYLEQQLKQKKEYMERLNQQKAIVLGEGVNETVAEEYLQAYAQWQSQNEAMHREVAKRRREYDTLQSIISSKQELLSEHERLQLKRSETNRSLLAQRESLTEQILSVGQTVQKKRIELAKQAEKERKFHSQIEEKEYHLRDLQGRITAVQQQLLQDLEEGKDKELMKALLPINGFNGSLQQLLRPATTKFQVCFHLLIGPIRKHLVCLDEVAAKSVALKLREKGVVRNLLILSNVKSGSQHDLRKELGRNAIMAIDAIDYEDTLPHFVQFLKLYLRNKVVCEGLEEAQQLLSKNLRGVSQVYTVDGNVLRVDGSVTSCGNPDEVKQSFATSKGSRLKQEQQLRKLQNEQSQFQNKLNQLRRKQGFDDVIKINLQLSRAENQIQEKKRRLKAIQNTETNFQDKGKQVINSIEKDLKQLRAKQSKQMQLWKDVEQSIAQSGVFAKFLKKHNLKMESLRHITQDEEERVKRKFRAERVLHELQAESEKTAEELRFLQQRVGQTQKKGQVASANKQLRQVEEELKKFKDALGSMAAERGELLHFHSQVGPLQTKLRLLKERHQTYLQEQAESLNSIHSFVPDQRVLEDHLGGEKPSRRKLETTVKVLEEGLREAESKLQQLNSLQLLASNPQDEEKLQNQLGLLNQRCVALSNSKLQINEQLEQVKTQRKQTLLQFIQQVKVPLEQAYSVLTLHEGFTGKAELQLESEQTPFEHGLYFSPTPPSKRFVYDLEQLSGGEKSIASLALHYAIAVATKSPLFLLDELDAFLDSRNLHRVLRLFHREDQQNRSENEQLQSVNLTPPLQLLFVTHKQTLFNRSDSLIGVVYPRHLGGSQTFTLRLP